MRHSPKLTRNSLPQEAIDYIKAAGYRVFMRHRADSYAFFASHDGVGYVQFEPMAGYTVATVHRPNKQSGTGYQIARDANSLNERILDDAIRITVPSWHHGHHKPRKYANIDEYRAANEWNSKLSEEH